MKEATGAHLLAEVPTYITGSWRRAPRRSPPALLRQLSSPPPSEHQVRYIKLIQILNTSHWGQYDFESKKNTNDFHDLILLVSNHES